MQDHSGSTGSGLYGVYKKSKINITATKAEITVIQNNAFDTCPILLEITFLMLLINRSSMTYPISVFIHPLNKPTINVSTMYRTSSRSI